MNPITFGSDPEFMLVGPNGVLKSAIGIVHGSKEEPQSIGSGHAVCTDNVLAECNIRATGSADDAVESFRECFKLYSKLVSPNRLTLRAYAEYPKSECKHKDAWIFGCDPDFDAYDVCVNPRPECRDTFRSAGGHVHIGYDGGADIEQGSLTEDEWGEALGKIAFDRIWVARMCDLFLGIPSLVLDKDPTSPDRRKLYGGAGSHRPKEQYGVEYRALSNFWLSRPSLVKLVYNLSTCATKIVMEQRNHEDIWEKEIDPDELRTTINQSNKQNVTKFMNVVKKYVPTSVMGDIEREMAKDYSPDFKQWGIES